MSNPKLEPLGDRIIVRVDPPPTVTAGGILLTDIHDDWSGRNWQSGIVEAIGPGLPDRKGVRRPPDVAIGERVYFSKWNEQRGLGYIVPWDKDLLILSMTHDVWAGSAPAGADQEVASD